LKLYTSFLVLQNVMDKFTRRLTIGKHVKRHQFKNLTYYNATLLILNPLCASLSPQNSTLFQLYFWAIMLVIIVFDLNCSNFLLFQCSIKCLDLILQFSLIHFTCFVILLHSKTFSWKSLYIIMWIFIEMPFKNFFSWKYVFEIPLTFKVVKENTILHALQAQKIQNKMFLLQNIKSFLVCKVNLIFYGFLLICIMKFLGVHFMKL
jgi:hypothetical protein